jgi:hypothetical protein
MQADFLPILVLNVETAWNKEGGRSRKHSAILGSFQGIHLIPNYWK